MSVIVEHDPVRDLILVRDSKKATPPIEWSRDMWESSVWARVGAGKLPARASEEGAVPDVFGLELPAWSGGAVRWAGHRFGPVEWRRFVDAVEAGDMSVEAIVGV